ncbi:hypothetical protein JG687_00019229 [Phytophthora cactorum]|uniref:Uncharacterized protein n=1 Tax=Phytophthora cactorum TaxID=29920 RepID=A0A8T1TKZ8_9STRA|nr:hypothetical protein JG687_00019229 [Phytophthora cactorum]
MKTRTVRVERRLLFSLNCVLCVGQTCPRRRERRRGLLAVELSKGTRCDLDLATDGVALPAAKLSVLDPINGGIVKYGMECCAKRSGGGTRASWRLLELL